MDISVLVVGSTLEDHSCPQGTLSGPVGLLAEEA